MMENRALIIASVASMIDLFNKDNINILEGMGVMIDVAANFQKGSITSLERVKEFRTELQTRNIKVIDLPCPRSIFQIIGIIKSYKIIKKLVEEKHYRFVHCHSPIGGVIARFACIDARKKGTKVVYTAHGFHFFKGAPLQNWLFYYTIEKLCSRMTDILLTINQEDFLRAQRWKTCRVEYVPGIGIHTEDFRNELVNRNIYRNEFGFKSDDFVFMSTGQISWRKNHEVIIRALAEIRNQKIKYLLVGFGEQIERLKVLSKKLGVQKQVVFAGYRGDVKQILYSVDGYAFPSIQEGLPVALMEAMSAGLPIICSKIRGNVDLIRDGKGGYIFDCNDVKGFAKGMEMIANGKGFEMGRINIETIKEFDFKIVNNCMRQIYYGMLN